MAVLTYIFGNFWHFMGACVLLTIIGILIDEVVTKIAKASIARSYMKFAGKAIENYKESEGDDESESNNVESR